MRGKIVTAFIFLTMMTGAVSAAPVLDYTGAERLEEARQREEERQERLRIPRIENIESSLNEKEETQGAAGPVFRIDEIILSGQEEKFGWLTGHHTAPYSHGHGDFIRQQAGKRPECETAGQRIRDQPRRDSRAEYEKRETPSPHPNRQAA